MILPEISAARRRRLGGEHTALNHARKRAVKAANAADDAPWSAIDEPRNVWDIRERETVERLRVATDGVWRAYLGASKARRDEIERRCAESPECAAAMVRIEERLVALLESGS